MAAIRSGVDIAAPAARVWDVVHRELDLAPRWSHGLRRIELLSPEPDVPGSRLRYHVDTPGGVQKLGIEVVKAKVGVECSGRFFEGPLKGDWKYAYREKDGVTRLTYTMDYGPSGFAVRLFFGMIEAQLPKDIEATMNQLKAYVEGGQASVRTTRRGAGEKAAGGRQAKGTRRPSASGAEPAKRAAAKPRPARRPESGA